MQTFLESALHGHIVISLALLDKIDWWNGVKKSDSSQSGTIPPSSFLSIGPSRLDL